MGLTKGTYDISMLLVWKAYTKYPFFPYSHAYSKWTFCHKKELMYLYLNYDHRAIVPIN